MFARKPNKVKKIVHQCREVNVVHLEYIKVELIIRFAHKHLTKRIEKREEEQCVHGENNKNEFAIYIYSNTFLKVFRREKGHGVQKEEKRIGKGKETKSLKVFIRLSNALFLKH